MMFLCAVCIFVLHITCGFVAAGILCADLQNNPMYLNSYSSDLVFSLIMGLSGGILALLIIYEITDSASHGCSLRKSHANINLICCSKKENCYV